MQKILSKIKSFCCQVICCEVLTTSNLSRYSLYYARVTHRQYPHICEEQHSSFWRNVAVVQAVGNTVSDLTGQKYEPPNPGREIFFSTMVLQIYYVTSVVPTLWFILRSRFSLDPLYLQAIWYEGTGQLG